MAGTVDANVNIKATMDVSDIKNKTDLITYQFGGIKSVIQESFNEPAKVSSELINDLSNAIYELVKNTLSLEGIIPNEQFKSASELVLGLKDDFIKLQEEVSKATNETSNMADRINSNEFEHGGLMKSLLENSSFNINSEENIRTLEAENAQVQALWNSINSEYDAMQKANSAREEAIQSSQLLAEQYNVLKGAIESTNVTNGTLASDTSLLNNNTNEVAKNTDKIKNDLKDTSVKTNEISKAVSSGIGKSVTGVVTGLNQGLDLIEKIYSAVVDLSEIAIEIEQSVFEMSNLLGGEATDAIIDYTEAMENLYGLDGTTLLNNMKGITVAVTKMGLATDDAVKVSENLGNIALNLGALTGDFDKAYKDLSNAIDRGFVGRGSSLYNILSKDEIEEMKSLSSEVDRFNYIMSKSERIGDTFNNFLQTENGQIWKLGQSFESLKSNVSLIAKHIYAEISPVLETIIRGLNEILKRVMTIFNISVDSFDYSGIADDFSASANKIKESADEAKRSLASFDDVIQINDNNKNNTDSYNNLGINPVEITKAIDDIDKKVNELFEKIKNGFKDGWNNAIEIGQVEKAIQDIINNIDGIRNKIIDIVTDPEVSSAIDNLVIQVSKTAGAIAGSAVALGTNIVAGITGGTLKFLTDNEEQIKENIVGIAKSATDLAEQIELASYNLADFSTVFNSEGFYSLVAGLENLGFSIFSQSLIIGTKLATGIFDGFNTIWSIAGPEIERAVEESFGAIGSIFDGFATIINGLGTQISTWFDSYLIPELELTAEWIGIILNNISTWWADDIAPAFKEFGNNLSTLWNEHLEPMFVKLKPWMDFLKFEIDIMIITLGALVDFIISVLEPLISGSIKNMLDMTIDIIGEIADLIGGIADLIAGILTGDIDKISSAFDSIACAVANGVGTLIEGAINVIIDIVNSVLGGINSVGKDYGVKLDLIPHIQIDKVDVPKLATGGIVTRSTIANIGEDGAEAIVPLERNTEWIDKLASAIASKIGSNNSNTGGQTVIDMSAYSKNFYTRSEMLSFADVIVKSLSAYGVNISIAY